MSSPSTGTILLVDDEESKRLALGAQLASEGHRVLTATDALEALHLIRTSHRQSM